MKNLLASWRSFTSNTFTARKIEILVGLLATIMIAVGMLLYAFDEPERIVLAQQAQLEIDLDEAMTQYAQNCAVCHGLAGDGIGSIPALDSPILQTADNQALAKIIARGLYGTAMPAWSIEDGGPLSEYQIDQLVLLVQEGNWQATQDRVVNLGLAPQVPFTTEADPLILETVSGLPGGEKLAQGVTLYAQECVACHGADGLGSKLAPALNGPEVRTKPEDELLRIIQNGVAGTLMASWENSLGDDQLAALLELITRWDEIPVGAIPAPNRPIAVTAESLAMGADLYTQSCSRCHGAEGQGTQRAPSLNVKGFLADTNDAALQQIITFGVPETAMPAWGDRLGEVEIQAIVGFIRSWEPTAPEVAIPARTGGGPWWSTSSSQPGSQVLPSGGQPGGGKGRGRGANPQGAGLDSTPNPTQIPTHSGTEPLLTETPPTPSPGWLNGQNDPLTGKAIQSDSTQNPPLSNTQASSNTGGHTQAGGGPPWAQATNTEIKQFSLNSLLENWREGGLITGTFLMGIVFISSAARGLRRLNREKTIPSPSEEPE